MHRGGAGEEVVINYGSHGRTVGLSRIRHISEVMEDDSMSESDVSWAENVFGEAPLSLDDENTPVLERHRGMENRMRTSSPHMMMRK